MKFIVNKLTKTILILTFFSKNSYSQSSRLITEEIYKPTKIEEARIFYNEGTNYISEEKYREAINKFKLAIEVDSNFIDAYDNLGLSYRRFDMLDSAAYYYKISMKKYPKGTASLMGLGVVYHIKGEYSKSEFYYKKLIELEPNNAEGYYGLTNTYLYWKKFSKSIENSFLAEKYYKENNAPKEILGDCYYLRSYSYYYLSEFSEARKSLTKAKENGIKVDSNLERALYGR
jgi:tetratricopeptide (TPR) repeat protein